MIFRRRSGPKRWRLAWSPNPMADPFLHKKRKSNEVGRRLKPSERAEFAPVDVVEIRSRFDQTQQEFADMMGISVDTLRNWERGRRFPQGPARALLRIADSDPAVVARVLTRHRQYWKPEEEEARSAHVENLLKRRAAARVRMEKAEKEKAQKQDGQDAAVPLESEATVANGETADDDLSWIFRD